MSAVLEIVTLLPSPPSGAWLAHCLFFHDGHEYETFIFLGLLGEMATDVLALIESGVPLERAREQFLHNVVLTGAKH